MDVENQRDEERKTSRSKQPSAYLKDNNRKANGNELKMKKQLT